MRGLSHETQWQGTHFKKKNIVYHLLRSNYSAYAWECFVIIISSNLFLAESIFSGNSNIFCQVGFVAQLPLGGNSQRGRKKEKQLFQVTCSISRGKILVPISYYENSPISVIGFWTQWNLRKKDWRWSQRLDLKFLSGSLALSTEHVNVPHFEKSCSQFSVTHRRKKGWSILENLSSPVEEKIEYVTQKKYRYIFISFTIFSGFLSSGF